VPLELAPTLLEQLIAELDVLMNHCRLVTISKRAVAPLELHHVRDRSRISVRVSALFQQLDDPGLGLLRR
jgi:hypothetical protein